MRTLIIMILMLIASNAHASQFCAVSSYGNVGACFHAYELCQSYVNMSGGYFVACVVK